MFKSGKSGESGKNGERGKSGAEINLCGKRVFMTRLDTRHLTKHYKRVVRSIVSRSDLETKSEICLCGLIRARYLC
jgi:hypothetical protein